MIVRCVNIFNEHTKEFQETSRSLTIGKEYIVLEVDVVTSRRVNYRLISDDGHTPALFNSKQFEIVNNKIPSNWIVYQIGELLSFTAKSWSELGFWEDYFNMVSEAIDTYEREKEFIFKESMS